MASRKEQKEQLKRERHEREQADAAVAKRRRMIGLLAGAIAVVAVVAVVLVVVSQGGNGGGSDVEGVSDVKKDLAGVEMAGLVMGDKKAPVKVVEFADLQCPACKQFNTKTEPEVIKRYIKTGKVQMEIVYMTFIGPDSATAAKAALAAAKQDRTWHFAQLMYKNQGAENAGYVTDEFLEGIATEIPDIDIAKWRKDLKDKSFDQKLKVFEQRAQAEGADSTPSFLFKGPKGQEEFTSGAIDIKGFAELVDPMLK